MLSCTLVTCLSFRAVIYKYFSANINREKLVSNNGSNHTHSWFFFLSETNVKRMITVKPSWHTNFNSSRVEASEAACGFFGWSVADSAACRHHPVHVCRACGRAAEDCCRQESEACTLPVFAIQMCHVLSRYCAKDPETAVRGQPRHIRSGLSIMHCWGQPQLKEWMAAMGLQDISRY